MKRLLSIFQLGIVCSCFFVACKSDLQEVTTAEQPVAAIAAAKEGITVSNGRLVFASKKAFQNTIEALSRKNEQERVEWESQFPFTSLRKNVASAPQAENSYDKTHETLKSILNDKGEYQVEETIIWLANNDDEYLVPSEKESVLQKLHNKESVAQKDYVFNKVKRSIKALDVSNKGARVIDGAELYWLEFFAGSTKYRHVFEAYQYEYSTHEVLGVQIKMDYWKVRTFSTNWLAAGELRYNEITNLRVSYCLPYSNCNLSTVPETSIGWGGYGSRFASRTNPLYVDMVFDYNVGPKIEFRNIIGNFWAKSWTNVIYDVPGCTW